MSVKTKIFLILIVFAVGICALQNTGCSGINDYVHITDMDYKAVLADSGVVTVTERITFDIHAASKNNTFWELWRDLPEEWENGKRVVSYNVLSVKRLTVNGKSDYLELGRASNLYGDDSDYIKDDPDLSRPGLGPNRWYHSKGPYDNYNFFECVLIYVDGLYRENTVFEIEYEIHGAAVKYADCSELYLPMYSGKTIKHLKSFSAQILIPRDIMPSDSYHAWTYGTTSHEIPFTQSTAVNPGYNTFSFSLKQSKLKFKAYNQYIEFSLVAYGRDKHIFTQSPGIRFYNENVYKDLMKAQKRYENLPAKYLAIKLAVLVIFIGISGLIVWLIYHNDKKYKNKYNLCKPAVDYDFYREIPSGLDAYFAGAFVFCKHKMSDDVKGGFPAAMMGLVRKSYIDVVKINDNLNWDSYNTKIIVTDIPQKDGTQNLSGQNIERKALSQTEAAYLNLIKRHVRQREISLDNFEEVVAADYEHTSAFTKGVKNSVKTTGQMAGYFKERDYKKLKRSARTGVITLAILGIVAFLANFISYRTRLDLAFGAFFILGCALFVSAVLLKRFSKNYVLLTQLGEDEYSKWRGLYNFLNSETLISERNVTDIAIWEEYLIYAAAFGISEKVLKALKVRFPEFNQSSSPVIRHPFFTTMLFTRIYARSFHGAVRRASVGHATSGFFGSGGGGYGSGGRGGGGGGGGH